MISLREELVKTLGTSKDLVDEGFEFHRKSIVIDMLCFDPRVYSDKAVKRCEELLAQGKSTVEINEELNKINHEELMKDPEIRKSYAEAWNRSGVTAGSITLSSRDFQTAVRDIALMTQRIDSFRNLLIKAIKAEHIRQAKAEGKHAIILNFQDTLAIGGGIDIDKELDNVDVFYGLGIRIIQLTYNLRNFVGDGCTERYQSGLTYFGIKLVERMNKLGMLIDLSHCGHQTTMDAIEVSKDPAAFTHTCCKSLYDHPRGKTDEEMKALAEKGGVVGIFAVKYFLAEKGTLLDVLNHIEKAVDLIGVDHVGIGTDHWYVQNYPERLAEVAYNEFLEGYDKGRRFWSGFRPEHRNDPRLYPPREPDLLAWVNWPAITVGLLSKGFSQGDVEKIIGGNWLRLLGRVIG